MASLALAFDILARDKASKAFDQVGDSADRAGRKGSKFGDLMSKGALIAGAAVGVFAVSSVKSASAAEQALGGVESVFGKAASAVEQFSSRSAKSIGLSKADYESLAAVVGSQLQRLGQSQAESAQGTDRLIGLGADLAATFGGSVSEAIGAVGALLRGERDPIERYGVGINEAAIKARLLKDGLGGLKGAALEQAKATTTLTLLTEQTKNAQGANAREAKTLEGQTIRLSAQYKDLSARIGTELLPVVTGAIEKFMSLAGFISRNRDVIVPLISILGSAAAAFLVVSKVIAITNAVLIATGSATTIALGPIGLIIIAIAALAGGLIYAYKHSETFRNAVNALGSFIKGYFLVYLTAGKIAVNAIGDALGGIVGFAEDAIRAIGRLASAIRNLPGVGAITGLVSKIPGFANGVTNFGGGLAIVGERGPELVRLPRGSDVYPTGTGPAMAPTGSNDDVLAELRALRGQIRALPRDYQLGMRQGLA